MKAIDKHLSGFHGAGFVILAVASSLLLSSCGMTQDEKRELSDARMRLTQKVTVVILAKNVEAGKPLTTDDIEVKEIDSYMYPYGGFTEEYQSKKEDSKVLGCVTTRYLGEGAVLMPGDIYPKKGDKADEAKSDNSTAKTDEKSDKDDKNSDDNKKD